MKRKYIDRADWARIASCRRVLIDHYEPRFSGYACAIFVETVQKKLTARMVGRDFTLVDDGYAWVQRLPEAAHWALTAMFDAEERIFQWYIDITGRNGVDEAGRPFYDDLYLDVVVLPSGEVLLLDEDELRGALRCGAIGQSEYDLAYREAERIMRGMAREIPRLTEMANEDLAFFKGRL